MYRLYRHFTFAKKALDLLEHIFCLWWLKRRRWEDNIKMVLQEVGWRGMEWIGLALYRDRWRVLVNAVMNLRVA